MKENSIEKKLENIQNVNLITLLRQFKKEGVQNFIVLRRSNFDEILSDYKRVLKENESLKEYNMEYKRILDLADDRIYRKKYLEERRKEQPNLLYPDSDEIYQRYCELKQENEELKISNKEIDKECSRLEKKEVELINENEHYEDLIYALKTYYDITEEDLEKCMKNDR